MSIFDKGLITILICNAIISLLAIPLILKKVPRNPVYGYRTRITLSGDAHWYKINAYFGLRLLVATFLSACAAVMLYEWQGLSPQAYLRASIALLIAPVVVAWLLTARFVRMIGTGCLTSKGGR